MAKFRKGDRVRLASHDELSPTYEIGSTGTVDENGSDYPWIRWDFAAKNGMSRWGCAQHNLELIEPQTDRMAELEARVAELERALAARQEPQPKPEFLQGARKHIELVFPATSNSPFNHADGTGIYVDALYEAVIIPNEKQGGTIIRFRRKNQAPFNLTR